MGYKSSKYINITKDLSFLVPLHSLTDGLPLALVPPGPSDIIGIYLLLLPFSLGLLSQCCCDAMAKLLELWCGKPKLKSRPGTWQLHTLQIYLICINQLGILSFPWSKHVQCEITILHLWTLPVTYFQHLFRSPYAVLSDLDWQTNLGCFCMASHLWLPRVGTPVCADTCWLQCAMYYKPASSMCLLKAKIGPWCHSAHACTFTKCA